MPEKRILLASLLKPVTDTRMYEKLGVSLCQIPAVQVHICGYAAPLPASLPANVHLHPLFKFKRLSLGRARAQLQYYQLLCRVKPHLLLVCTHELLLPSLYYARKYNCPLVYDVQENYALNLKAQHNYPKSIKHVLAWGVSQIEKKAATQINHFLLAERSYAAELSFVKDKYTFVENKYKPGAGYTLPVTPVALPPGPLRLLYTGTISEVYGVFEAIAFASAVQEIRPGSTLTIIGYSPSGKTWQQVKALTARKPYITLIGGDYLLPHQQILEKIQHSDLGLLPYQPNASTFRCIPTKLYEYMAHGLPVLIQYNPLWQDIIGPAKAGISIDFKTFDAAAILQQVSQQQFYTSGVPVTSDWAGEEQKLLAAITPLLEVANVP